MTESVKTQTTHHVALGATTAYGNSFDAIYVGVTGNIDVIIDGDTVGYDNVSAGMIHPISGEGVAASTTADTMVLMSW
jgi:hypothetical protein